MTTTTQTLESFLSDHAVCRVWFAGVGHPSGCEVSLNTDTDCDEDYVDAESLLNVIPGGTDELEGTVTQDADGEWRWEVASLTDADLRDSNGNTIYNLVVWGTKGKEIMTESNMTLVFDNGLNADEHFMLEQDADGLLYETSNAVTRELVSAAMFAGWGIEQEPRASQWIDELEQQFGSREVADRYYAAATDTDK